MNSREWFNLFKEFLKDNKFNVAKEKFYNGYFIIEMGTDSVIHFEIKECRGWLFALWFEFGGDSNEITKVTFFTRHKDDLDKFKPSRTFFTINFEVGQKFNKGDLWYVVELCRQIHQHPIISYCIDNQNSYIGGFGFVEGNLLFQYIKNRASFFKKYVEDYFENKTKLLNLTLFKLRRIKKMLDKEKEVISKVKIIDMNTDNFKCSPRFILDITWNSTLKEHKADIGIFTIPFYKWNGKKKINPSNASIDWHFLNDKKHYSFVPTQEELELVYGWRYKLYKRIFNKNM